MPTDITSWGISESNSAVQNSQKFNDNIASGQTLYLPGNSNPYEFAIMRFENVNNVEFYGDPDTVIKFKDTGHSYLFIADADYFNIHDLKFNGRKADIEGGIQADDGATNGTIKNVKVYDPHDVGIVIGGNDYELQPKTFNITVEDCEVYGLRNWGGNAKASFLAGGGADDITFKNCTAYRKGFYDTTDDSPADHFDTDNATNVEYQNCVADGSGIVNNDQNRKGVGFWNEAGGENSEDHETSSTYYNCTAIKTAGGLAATENSSVKAYNCTFDECSDSGWAAWSHGTNATLEVYNSIFDRCHSYYQHFRGGCVVIEGAATIDNCEFINTPTTSNDEYNITLYTSDGSNNKTVTIENNSFDRSIRGFNASEGTGDVYVRYNNFASGTEIIQGGDYNWIVSGNDYMREATTTAINSPTSNTIVFVSYDGHLTRVNYDEGTPLYAMASLMVDAINNDSGAKITATSEVNNITFTQKDPNSTDNDVNFVINIEDWMNGGPFNPMNPTMS